MGRLTYTMENNGDSISLNNILHQDYFKAAGATGLGVAPTRLVLREGATAGSRFRSSKRTTRYIDLPLIIFGSDAQAIEDKMRRLVRLWNDTYTSPTLRARYEDGSEWTTEIHFAGGADPVFGSEDTDGKTFCKWLVSLAAPDPYFTSTTPVVIETIKAANSGRGLIKTGGGGLSRLRLSSSQTIGSVEVNNPGDIDAFPIWTVQGPGDSFTATRAIDGASFFFDEQILDTEIITFNAKTKLVVDQLGDNRYGDMPGAPVLFSVPPGTSTINILVPNADSDTKVDMSFYPRRELLFG